ncbi:hypothetical protein GCM10010282_49670 [Streptomyces roseolus]|nr:hypothetical protein GCM10010282_49670 [Streptomyces roseolus]
MAPRSRARERAEGDVALDARASELPAPSPGAGAGVAPSSSVSPPIARRPSLIARRPPGRRERGPLVGRPGAGEGWA